MEQKPLNKFLPQQGFTPLTSQSAVQHANDYTVVHNRHVKSYMYCDPVRSSITEAIGKGPAIFGECGATDCNGSFIGQFVRIEEFPRLVLEAVLYVEDAVKID